MSELLARRAELQSQLALVDREIAAQGSVPAASDFRKSRGRNAKSLRQHVLELLTDNPHGYSLAELSLRVLGAGYLTDSNNFRNVLYQCLYNTKGVYHDEQTATYRLRPSSSEATKRP